MPDKLISYHASHVHEREKREYRDYMASKALQIEQMSTLPDYVFHFDSQNRSVIDFPSAHDFTLQFTEPITHVESITMQTIRLPNVMNLIRSGKNQITWRDTNASSPIVTTLLPGQYSVDSLLSAFVLQVGQQTNQKTGQPYFMSYTYNASNNNIDISNWHFTSLQSDPFTTLANSSILTCQIPSTSNLSLMVGQNILLSNTSVENLNDHVFTVISISGTTFTFDSGIQSSSAASIGGSTCKIGIESPFKFIHTPTSCLPFLGFPPYDSSEVIESIVPTAWTILDIENAMKWLVRGDFANANKVMSIYLSKQKKVFDVDQIMQVNSDTAWVTLAPHEQQMDLFKKNDVIYTDVASFMIASSSVTSGDNINVICKSIFDFQTVATVLDGMTLRMDPKLLSLFDTVTAKDTLVSWSRSDSVTDGYRGTQTNAPTHYVVALVNPLYMRVQLPDWVDKSQLNDYSHNGQTLLAVKLDSSPESFLFVDQSTQSFHLQPKSSSSNYYPTLSFLRLTLSFPNLEIFNLKNFNYSGTIVFKRKKNVRRF